MPIARKHLISADQPGCYHLISRCVRRAFLCGDRAEHRRAWVTERIQAAAASFTVDVLAYAVMGNHLHVVVRTDPDRVARWTANDVAQRWAVAHPHLNAEGACEPWDPALIETKAGNAAWISRARGRLRSISWFMKSIKEQLARRANRADRCTGHFWEGRFQSVPLLDERAILACMAYVDLNPIRARMATTPETSDHTSVQARIHHRQLQEARDPVALTSTQPPTAALGRMAEEARQAAAEQGHWLAPISSPVVGMAQAPLLTRDDYLTLVDQTGRVVRGDKRGAIPAHLPPILERLELNLSAWMDLMQGSGAFRGSAFGSIAARAREALRRGARWIVDRTRGLYRDPVPISAA